MTRRRGAALGAPATLGAITALVIGTFFGLSCSKPPRTLEPGEDPLGRAEILAVARRVADWQLAHPRYDPRDWTNAVFYSGLIATSRITGERGYLAPLIELGEKHDWQLLPRLRHADDHALAQTYLELARIDGESERYGPFQAAIEEMMSRPAEWPKEHQPIDFWWCDALFMSPPALVLLARETGDERYLDFMDRLWRETHELLYNHAESLFYRDTRFREQAPREFWSRGNGWVLAGLARTLEPMPPDRPARAFYEEVFRQMAERAAELQPPDGLWRSDLFETGAVGESSGTALFSFALAWGVNAGLLEEERFLPVVERAWAALYRNVDLDGRLGWVQQPGGSPESASSRSTGVYGSGAFLLAAEEMLELVERRRD